MQAVKQGKCPVGIRKLPPEKWLERDPNGLDIEVEVEVEQPKAPDAEPE